MTKTVEERLRAAKANGDPAQYIAGISVQDAHEAADLIKEMREALGGLLVDVTIAQGNMRTAAKYDLRWEGCAEAIEPRVIAARTALKRAEARNG